MHTNKGPLTSESSRWWRAVFPFVEGLRSVGSALVVVGRIGGVQGALVPKLAAPTGPRAETDTGSGRPSGSREEKATTFTKDLAAAAH